MSAASASYGNRSVEQPEHGSATPLLSVRDLAIRFGGIVALDKVSFDIAAGAIQGLIGPNGAGKTTLFNCITRLYTPNEGDVKLAGRSILSAPAHGIASLGITRTFQNLALFSSMTVRDNVRVGAHAATRSNVVADMLSFRDTDLEDERRIDELLASLELSADAERPVADLPTGTKKRVELARALAGRPKLLLLDEPAGGLNHGDVADLGRLIRRIRDETGVTILLVEHHMSLVMGVCDRVVALDFGRKIADGTPAEVREHAEVVRAYLGDGSKAISTPGGPAASLGRGATAPERAACA